MVSFAPLDWLVFAGFAGLILALGFSARLRDSSVLQYLTAGRSLSLPAFVATLVSTWYGGILGIAESVQFFGLGTWVMLGLPYYVFGVVYALFYAKRVRAADQISLPERLESAFGRSTGLVGAVLVFLLGVPAAHVLMLGVLATSFTGWDLVPAVLVATVVGVAFLWRGGLLADVRMSLVAFAMMYVGFGTMLVWCLTQHPPSEAFVDLRESAPALFTWDGGQGWLTVVGFFLLGAWTLIDPGFHQRAASARSPQVSQKGVLVGVVCWMVFDLLSIGTAMYALALVSSDTIAANGGALAIFPTFAETTLPPGLKALFVCGMLGTILSAMVGYTLVSGGTLGREVVGRLRRGSSDSDLKTWSRWGVVAACALAVVLALQLESVVGLWYHWGGAVVGALLLPVSFAYGVFGSYRPPALATLASMIVGFGVAFVWMVYGYQNENPFLTVQWGEGESFALGTIVPGLVASATTLGVLSPLSRKNGT